MQKFKQQMNVWRQKNQKIKDYYLKIKKIILLKIIREKIYNKIYNESLLLKAFLWWRTSRIPNIDWYKVNQIRSGCQIFEICLKKHYQNQFFENINLFALHCEKIYSLKKLIEKLEQEKYEYKYYFFDLLKIKTETQKMKEKMHFLFQDYILSDKGHESLFKSQKMIL